MIVVSYPECEIREPIVMNYSLKQLENDIAVRNIKKDSTTRPQLQFKEFSSTEQNTRPRIE